MLGVGTDKELIGRAGDSKGQDRAGQGRALPSKNLR